MVKRALAGDKESASLLGSRFFKESDYTRARPWLELASELGDSDSAYMMGLLLRAQAKHSNSKDEATNAHEVINEIKEARKEARRARKEKKRSSQANLAEEGMVVSSKDVDPADDVDSAVFWLRKAAKENHESAMVLLANILIEEEDMVSKREALKMYRKAAKMDHPDALFNLGTLHFNGIEDVLESDEESSLPYFEKAASLGDEASLYWVGHCYLSGEGGVAERDTRRAMTCLQSAADKGHVGAHYHLAVIYRNGMDVVPLDKEAFVHHLTLAVEGEDADALFCLADCYMQGLDGYDADQSKALPLLAKAAAANHADAAVTLGALYYGGLAGLTQDKRKAFELYNTAAEQGSQEAWRNLASMYYLGDGVPKSEEVARQIMRVVFNKDADGEFQGK
jgi:TPR repeat protein